MGNRWGYPTRQNIIVESVSKEKVIEIDETTAEKEEPEISTLVFKTEPSLSAPMVEQTTEKEETSTTIEEKSSVDDTTTSEITEAVAALSIATEAESHPGEVNREEKKEECPPEVSEAPDASAVKKNKKKRYRYYKK